MGSCRKRNPFPTVAQTVGFAPLERELKVFSWLDGHVCTTCAPGDQEKSQYRQRERGARRSASDCADCRAGRGYCSRKVLARAGLTLDDIDLFEVNEAFAVAVEKYIRDLRIDRNKINVNGGSIALGHPIGATGTVLIGASFPTGSPHPASRCNSNCAGTINAEAPPRRRAQGSLGRRRRT
ncbi:hypothetical protein GPL21_05720 [Bradyrhizobium pachyrhizi]|uniref:Thiolase C-terminal domain-containing protein n=1 Tax=Bradyrhizobium pachyrhizi TaxID=280333 RepID=A0A844SMH0_9BRAD|nr:hypothetical protein [Bradyrhizobium pachyrhizi]